jgi:hypothetical protein
VHVSRLVSVVKMATVLEDCTTKQQRFLWSKGLNAKHIHKEILRVYGGVCRLNQFTAGSRNSLKDIQKSQMMPNQVPLLRMQQKQLCSRWMSQFELTEDNDRQCSSCTWAFPWFSIQHDTRSFKVFQKCKHSRCPEN